MKCEKCGNNVVITSRYQSGRFCSRACANSRIWTNEHNKKLSKKMKGYHFGNADIYDPTRILVYSIYRRPKKSPIEKTCVTCHKSFLSSGRKTCSIECEHHAPGRNGGFRINSTRKIRSIYKGFWMDSGAERRFAELMDANDILWYKNTSEWFPYRDKVGKSRKYYPDFYLPEYDYWVEIKGRLYQNENDPLKLKCVGENIEMQMHDKIRLPSCI